MERTEGRERYLDILTAALTAEVHKHNPVPQGTGIFFVRIDTCAIVSALQELTAIIAAPGLHADCVDEFCITVSVELRRRLLDLQKCYREELLQ